ncbi:uncharacterized protein [Musca autumnalis]|uniref:uncharacterized protein n=1 Tax=Musca autumnalis TaxID=221902 RepID=UPI003CF8F03A
MTTAHVYFAEAQHLSSPSSSSANSVAAPEGHRSNFEAPNNDATLQRQCSSRNATNRNTLPGSNSAMNTTTTNTTCAGGMPSNPHYERNMGFFRQLSRRFGLRSNDDLVYSGSNEEDNQSSSTDSCSSHRENSGKDAQRHQQYCNASNIMTASMMTMSITEHISCASSETSSTVDIEEQQHQQQELENDHNHSERDDGVARVTNGKSNASNGFHKDRKSFARSSFSRLQRRSASSIRKAFETFSLSSRSLSCSGTTPPPTMSLASTHMHNTSSSSSSSTPIKSALKSTSNLELNKKHNNTAAASASSSSNSSASTTASCSSKPTTTTPANKSTKTKTKPPPQRILRQPVSYTYLKGISGLPTQRVPRNSVCCQYARR